ncbi:Oxidoreductase [hydrothermal vent metagenome]|uniref:Oxidoreductase n=1 Tax=hydrothermal vent metagenome TaxID=652676 RepID=A0A3B1BB32_9ZZZZ
MNSIDAKLQAAHDFLTILVEAVFLYTAGSDLLIRNRKNTMTQNTICLLGGTGFVGRHLLSLLSKQGHHILVLSRHPQRHRDLKVLPGVELIHANVHDIISLRQHFTNADAVINLVGILNERHDNGKGFHHVHVELTRNILHACHDRGVRRLLHMSALNADPAASSYYLRSKGEAEQLVLQAKGLDVTCFRPSVIFGPGDRFINRFARILKITPLFFPLACGYARLAPVYVGDVAQAFADSLDMQASFGQSYDLCGPHRYTLQEIVEYVNQILELKRIINPLGNVLSRLQANLLEHIPGKPFSKDNFRSLQTDSICPKASHDLQIHFGINPSSMKSIVPGYLLHQKQKHRYDHLRQQLTRCE